MSVPMMSALLIEVTFSRRFASRLSRALLLELRDLVRLRARRPAPFCTELSPSCATVSTALSRSAMVVDSVADAVRVEVASTPTMNGTTASESSGELPVEPPHDREGADERRWRSGR